MKVPAPIQEPSIAPEQEIVPPNDEIIQNNSDDDNKFPFKKEKFDAGIDVDEDADPKKYIEKLTGKLAQKLRDYNETSDDVDLNKFVINSLIPASIPEMEENDAQDVIKKVKDNIGKENNNDNNDSTEEQGINNEPEQEMGGDLPPVPQEESKQDNIDDLISELLNPKKVNSSVKNKDPFKPKKFK